MSRRVSMQLKIRQMQNMRGIICSANQVISVRFFQFHVLHTELAYPQLRLLSILLWIWREIPCVDLILADLHLVNILHLCYLSQITDQ